jgi:hypothetical protein
MPLPTPGDSSHGYRRRRPTSPRGIDRTSARNYANSRGAIHRDIKPANIILGNHGETLVVDWGLAKLVGRADPSAGEQTIAPSSSGSSETLPGSAMGTPAYMSPEQASGDLDRLGPRSDVYSLGATLYCLLTAQPPFEGNDIGEVLRRAQAGDFRAPRGVDPSLDKALEAVCLKAMATKPADRYASGRALAEDVEQWMADEPVTAYPEPWVRTLVRWLTRHRTGVTGVAAALLAGVVGLSAVLAVQTRANAALEDERAKTEKRFELAQKAIATFHTDVSEDMLPTPIANHPDSIDELKRTLRANRHVAVYRKIDNRALISWSYGDPAPRPISPCLLLRHLLGRLWHRFFDLDFGRGVWVAGLFFLECGHGAVE